MVRLSSIKLFCFVFYFSPALGELSNSPEKFTDSIENFVMPNEPLYPCALDRYTIECVQAIAEQRIIFASSQLQLSIAFCPSIKRKHGAHDTLGKYPLFS